MTYLIFGNGWMGNLIKEYLGENARIWSGRDINALMVNAEFSYFDVWINAAGKTNIDWCEKNKHSTLMSNVIGAANLAFAARDQKKKLVHLSSACIFESKNKKDIKYEDANPSPKCFYAET